MKSKLVKYPFDEKKYRWDTQKIGKEFEYFWKESRPNNFETITPYIKIDNMRSVYKASIPYALIDLDKDVIEYDEIYYDDISKINWNGGNTTNTFMLKDAIALKNSILPLEDIRYVYYMSYDQFLDYELPVGTTQTCENKVYDNGVWRYATRTTYKADHYDSHGGYEHYWKQEYSPQGEMELTAIEPPELGPTAHNSCYLNIYDVNGELETSIRVMAWHTGDYYDMVPYCSAIVKSNATFNGYIIKYDENDIWLTLTPSNPSPLTRGEYNWIQSTHPPVGVILNMLARAGYTTTNYQYSNYPGYSVVYETNAIKIYSSIPYVYHREHEHIEDYYQYPGIASDQDWEASKNIYYYGGAAIDDYSIELNNYTSNWSWGYRPQKNYGYADEITLTSGQEIWVPIYCNNAYIGNNIYKTTPSQFTRKDITSYQILYDDYLVPYDNSDYIAKYTNTDATMTTSLNFPTGSEIYINIFNWGVNTMPVHTVDTNKYLAYPIVRLVGDKTDNIITIPSDNTTILAYTIGDAVDMEHLNVKTLQINAPCQYDANGDVISKTWLTYNTYTSSQWLNGYHFLGNQWNNIGSPWAYAGYMTNNSDHYMNMIEYFPCEEGHYANVFYITNQSQTVAVDTLGNNYSVNSQQYYDNIGSLFYFGDGEVESSDRYAYPDDGIQNQRYYVLEPEKTIFVEYVAHPSTDELTNVELFHDRYHYTHNYTEWVDRSYEGTVCGTSSSTGEDTIPDGTYRTYKGLYLGESIPFLHITEQVIPDSILLSVPQYDKQINTSDTLKYGTVASAGITFNIDEPVEQAINHSGELYVLYYDYTHYGIWDRMGFFRVDSVEALDEYASRITAHDEVYKLNKYVDDFLENYSQETTLGNFYKDLLDYCGCWYDEYGSPISNAVWPLNNVYHAVKTTGIEVAHFIATISPGFIEANIDGDVELNQYNPQDYYLSTENYTDLVYNAYNSDLLDKVRIVANNAVLGEDSGTGENIYFISDNPLISSMESSENLNTLASFILAVYENIPDYRPAEVQLLQRFTGINIGDIINIITPKGDIYKIAIMAIMIDASGVKITSFGTQTYPVESENNSQFINLINDIDNVSGDVSNLDRAVDLMGQTVAQTVSDVSSLDGRMTATESSLSTTASTVSSLQSTIGTFTLSTNSDLTTITLNGNTASGLTNSSYVAQSISTSEAKNSVTSANSLASVKINNNTVSEIALKSYVDSMVGTSLTILTGSLTYTETSVARTANVFYIGNPTLTTGIFIPQTTEYHTSTWGFKLYNNKYYIYKVGSGSTSPSWTLVSSVTFTPD